MTMGSLGLLLGPTGTFCQRERVQTVNKLIKNDLINMTNNPGTSSVLIIF